MSYSSNSNSKAKHSRHPFFDGRPDNYRTWVTGMNGPISGLDYGVALMDGEVKLGPGKHPTVDLGERINARCRDDAMNTSEVRSMVLKLIMKSDVDEDLWAEKDIGAKKGTGVASKGTGGAEKGTGTEKGSAWADEKEGSAVADQKHTGAMLTRAKKKSTGGKKGTFSSDSAADEEEDGASMALKEDGKTAEATPLDGQITEKQALSHAIMKDRKTRVCVDWQTRIQQQKAKEEVLKSNSKLYSLIFMCLSASVRKHVEKLPKGHGIAVWNSLKKKYEKQTASTMHKLLREFYNAKMEPTEKVADFHVRISRIADKLADMNRKVNDDDYLAALVYGLPDDFKQMRVAITNGSPDQTYDQVLTKLEAFEETELTRGKKNNGRYRSKERDGAALAANGDSRECFACGEVGHISSNCKSKSKLECTFCKKKGHVEKTCFKKNGKKGQAKLAKGTKGNATVNLDEESDTDEAPAKFWGLGL